MLKLTTFLLLAIIPAFARPHCIDFEKIKHWTGTGPNRAALVLQFPSDVDPYAYVWGYRWDDGFSPTGEEMVKAICSNSTELAVLTQNTGMYGSTLCGVGFGDAQTLLADLYFDFEMAKTYEWINFDYYNGNLFFGQNGAPGDNAPQIARHAIEAAYQTHVVLHPFDYTTYGYPAYDYDCWKLTENSAGGIWLSGWYTGYWSYWLSSSSTDEWTYSGTGFTGRKLTDGAIDAWSYTPFDEPGVGGFGEGNPPTDNPDLISYRPAATSGIDAITDDVESGMSQVYSISGIKVATFSSEGQIPPLKPGIYLIRTGKQTRKIIIR